VASKRRIFSATECVLALQGHSRSSKVNDFGTNRKRNATSYMSVIVTMVLVLHRLWDTATYWLKLRIALSHSAPSFTTFPFEFHVEFTMRKLESWGYHHVKTAWS